MPVDGMAVADRLARLSLPTVARELVAQLRPAMEDRDYCAIAVAIVRLISRKEGSP